MSLRKKLANQKSISRSLFWIAVTAFAVYLGIRFAWSERAGFTVVGFFIGLFSSFLFSVNFSKLFFHFEPEITTWQLLDKATYKKLEEFHGKRFTRFSWLNTSIWILTISISAYVCVSSINNYKNDQLTKYGKLQKVLIHDDSWHRRHRSVTFNYYHKGETWTESLPAKDYQVGDSVFIFYSTDNPNIVVWPGESAESE